MFAWDIAFWFCCLNPREREVLRLTVEGLILTVNVGIPLAAWDLFWFTYSPNGDALRVAFRSLYKLEIGTILVGEPPVPVDAVVSTDYATVLSWGLFLLTLDAVCSDGCEQSTVG